MERLPYDIQEEIYKRVHKMHFKDINDHLIAHTYMFYFDHMMRLYNENIDIIFGLNMKERRKKNRRPYFESFAVLMLNFTDAQQKLIDTLLDTKYPIPEPGPYDDYTDED